MKTRFMVLASAALLASVLSPRAVFAEDEPAEPAQDQPQEKVFHMLPLCRLMEGGAEVLRPGAEAWEPLEEGRFYPLGCAYRTLTPASRLTIQFGRTSEVRIEGVASFGTRVQEVGLKDRTIILRGGVITVSLPRNMPMGVFKVAAPGFTAMDLAGESVYTYEGTGDGDVATIRCVTGSLAVEGRHFRIPAMKVADVLKVRTSQDLLFTGLYGTSGDYIVKLDQGVVSTKDLETGVEKEESRQLDWHLSPQTAVRIHRAVPKIGARMSATVMTFDETGALVNRCAFAEGLASVNTGEQGEKALAAKEERALKAVEGADAVTTEAAPEATITEKASAETSATTTEENIED